MDKKNTIILTLIFMLSFVGFSPILLAPNLIDKDYALVVGPLTQVDSIKTYFDLFLTKKLLDVQPVRDLFLLIDIFLQRQFQIQFFGMTNWLLWLATCLVCVKISYQIQGSKPYLPFIALMACHPMLAWILSWPIAKKHLLACFFIMLFSLLLIQYKKGQTRFAILIFLVYNLALLSQPIILFAPLVALVYLNKEIKKKENYILVSLLIISMLFWGWISWLYYAHLIPQFLGFSPSQPPILQGIIQRALAISRSFTQIFIPYQFASNYSITSPFNFFGLPLFIFLTIIGIKRWTHQLFFVALVGFPLMTVNAKISSVFVSDTYLLTSLCFVVLGLMTQYVKIPKVMIMILLFVFTVKSYHESTIATNQEEYLQTSYDREPECKNIIGLTQHYLFQNKLTQFEEFSGIALANRCLIVGIMPQLMVNEIYAFRLFIDKGLSDEEKLHSLLQHKIVTPDVLVLQHHLLLQLEREDQAKKLEEQIPWEDIKYLHVLKVLTPNSVRT